MLCYDTATKPNPSPIDLMALSKRLSNTEVNSIDDGSDDSSSSTSDSDDAEDLLRFANQFHQAIESGQSVGKLRGSDRTASGDLQEMLSDITPPNEEYWIDSPVNYRGGPTVNPFGLEIIDETLSVESPLSPPAIYFQRSISLPEGNSFSRFDAHRLSGSWEFHDVEFDPATDSSASTVVEEKMEEDSAGSQTDSPPNLDDIIDKLTPKKSQKDEHVIADRPAFIKLPNKMPPTINITLATQKGSAADRPKFSPFPTVYDEFITEILTPTQPWKTFIEPKPVIDSDEMNRPNPAARRFQTQTSVVLENTTGEIEKPTGKAQLGIYDEFLNELMSTAKRDESRLSIISLNSPMEAFTQADDKILTNPLQDDFDSNSLDLECCLDSPLYSSALGLIPMATFNTQDGTEAACTQNSSSNNNQGHDIIGNVMSSKVSDLQICSSNQLVLGGPGELSANHIKEVRHREGEFESL